MVIFWDFFGTYHNLGNLWDNPIWCRLVTLKKATLWELGTINNFFRILFELF